MFRRRKFLIWDVIMEGEVEDIYRELLQVEEPVGLATWSSFLFNIELARKLEAYLSPRFSDPPPRGGNWQLAPIWPAQPPSRPPPPGGGLLAPPASPDF